MKTRFVDTKNNHIDKPINLSKWCVCI